jgi:iron complex outermembrane receptor protein
MIDRTKILLLAGASALAVAAPGLAAAQTKDAPASSTQIETVVVTARKSSEDQLKVPVAVTAFTQKALEARGIQAISDLAQFTPGMADQQTAYSGDRADRSFQTIILRGMNPSSVSNPTTSIFINGTPVSSSDMLSALSDIDHIEVLKGPQSAYFGRETFAGAVNVVSTSAPNHLTGDLNLGYGSRNTYNMKGNIGAPIIADKLMATIGGNYQRHDGSYNNASQPGQLLGNQMSQSIHLGVTFKPIENLTIKTYSLFSQDRDGPSATGIILAANPNGKGQSNCTVNNAPWFCGTLPGLNYAVTPAQNTTLTPAAKTFLNTATRTGGVIEPKDLIKDFGLKRDAMHHDWTIAYEMPNLGLTFTYLGAYNSEQYSELSDLANLDGAAGGQYPGYTGFPFIVEGTSYDFSHEFRVASDPKKPLRGMLGVSYVDQHGNSAIGAPTVALPTTGGSESITEGVFFSLGYDILPKLTLTFDGRYQSDNERSYPTKGVLGLSGTATAFLPRVSLQFKFTPDIMSYFTYSQGTNPGVFNTTLATLPTQTLAAMKAAGLSPSVAVMPENITNYEIGFKGKFLNGRATLAADVYYDQWTNELDNQTINFAQNSPANPYCIAGQQLYNLPLCSSSIYPVNFIDNSAASNPKGVEIEGNLIPVDHLTLNGSMAYTDTRYTKFTAASNVYPYSTFNAAGKYQPYAPQWSATGGVQWADTTSRFGGQPADWFVRADVVWNDGQYIQATNTVKTPDLVQVNLRGSITRGRFGFDAYVNNLFNNKSYVSGFQGYDFTNFAGAAFLALPNLVTVGFDLKYRY